MSEIRSNLSKIFTPIRNRLSGLFFKIYYMFLAPVYFSKLGTSFYCLGFIRFKHLFADISIGKKAYFGPRMTLDVAPGAKLKIGDNCAFTGDSVISAAELVEIGDDCIFSEFVSIRDANHGMKTDAPMFCQKMSSAPIKIGNNVWLGRGAVILKGVKIGSGAVIGANAVVNRDIPDNAIAAGVPARVIKYRS